MSTTTPDPKQPTSSSGSWLEGVNEASIKVVVQSALILIWAAMAALVLVGIVFPVWGITTRLAGKALSPGDVLPQTPTNDMLVAAVWLLSALPYPLSVCAALLVQQRVAGRKTYHFLAARAHSAPPWKDALVRVRAQWRFEAERSRDGLKRVVLYAGFLGCIASVTLSVCALLLYGHMDPVTSTRTSVTLTVCAAACTSFGVTLGRIVIRAAHRDGSGKMFAWATRSLILSILAAMLLVLLLAQSKETTLVSSVGGFMATGIAVALFGERVLQAIMDRAAKMMGVTPTQTPAGLELTQISGLSEEDIERLAEEGIDNVHALAYVPTARLYFNATYSLQRLTSWQDQAMLIVATGAKATLFREMMVYGAMDAQALAERFQMAPAPTADGAEASGLSKEDRDVISKMLGFGTLAQASVALGALCDDEVTRRLRIYAAGTVERVEPKPGSAEARAEAAEGVEDEDQDQDQDEARAEVKAKAETKAKAA